MHRRDFLQRTALALAATTAPAPAFAAPPAQAKRPRAVFTKFLEHLPAAQLAEKCATLGVDGIEAPIRAGGHIDPKKAADLLPPFVEALAKHNLSITILTSDINQANADAESLLRTAAKLGITRYRLAHLRYDLKKPIAPQLSEITARLTDLAAMNRDLGVQGQYQNHRGNNYVGGPIWDMLSALENIDPKHLGLAFDLAHATVEGANAWELNLRRAAPHIVAVYAKDYRLDGKQWNPCPLGQGVVNPHAATLVKQLLPANTPISLHIEYIGGKPPERDEKTFAAMKADLATLDRWFT
jgi:sugar phosphate isomerase/epimerase